MPETGNMYHISIDARGEKLGWGEMAPWCLLGNRAKPRNTSLLQQINSKEQFFWQIINPQNTSQVLH